MCFIKLNQCTTAAVPSAPWIWEGIRNDIHLTGEIKLKFWWTRGIKYCLYYTEKKHCKVVLRNSVTGMIEKELILGGL